MTDGEWQARAEELAGAFREVMDLALMFALDPEEMATWRPVRTRALDVLARLPAQALAERRALDECAEYIRDHHECPDCDSGCLGCRYIAALDAARREGGA